MASDSSDINIGLLVTISVVTVLLVIVVVLGMTAALRWAYETEREQKLNMVAPGPHLDGSESLNTVNSSQLADITKTEWVDQEKGLVRIPIDRAMQLYAERQQREQ